MNFTRKRIREKFHADAVRFELEVELPEFAEDTHLIVATIGEGLKLGPVMGPENVANCHPWRLRIRYFLTWTVADFRPMEMI